MGGVAELRHREAVIGLETHAQLVANTKLFSGAPSTVLGKPNTFVALQDMAAPGALPVLNAKAVEQGVRTGLALHGTVNLVSHFDRKHYFYADLPAGYQITQQAVPLIEGGYIELVMPTYTKKVQISHLRLEVDSGKSVHDAHPFKSFLDMNRAGMGLMEIVSEPELRTADEAAAYLRQLTAILRAVGSCHGSMEEGSLRCDVNVSLRRRGDAAMGTRAEVKNVNKIKHVQKAVGARRLFARTERLTASQSTRLSARVHCCVPVSAWCRRRASSTRAPGARCGCA